MLRVVFLLMMLGFVSAVKADVSIYVEDFEDKQGNAGFDPMFNHSFSNDSGEPNWGFFSSTSFPENGTTLGVYSRTKDTITFNLPAQTVINYASVDVFNMATNSQVKFVGTQGTFEMSHDTFPEFKTFEITNTVIGDITAIELFSVEGVYDNITIRVVPEPSTVILGLIGIVMSSAALLRQSRRKYR